MEALESSFWWLESSCKVQMKHRRCPRSSVRTDAKARRGWKQVAIWKNKQVFELHKVHEASQNRMLEDLTTETPEQLSDRASESREEGTSESEYSRDNKLAVPWF